MRRNLQLAFRACTAGLAAAFAIGTAVLAAQPPELDDLLDKAADYVAGYKRNFAGVVADETYRQEARGGPRGTDLRGYPVEGPRQKQDLKADVLFVRAPDAEVWMQFRDVYEVNGKPVRDRAERLAKLFLEPSRSAQKQVEDIAAESARFNIGDVNRTINLPVLALTLLETSNRPWIAFTGTRKKHVWDLEFREERGGTLIRTTDSQSMPSHGRFLIEAETGRVLESDLIAESSSLRARIEVTYTPEPALGGMLVPSVMREKYTLKDGAVIDGRASYSRFRRYQVQTDEKVAPVQEMKRLCTMAVTGGVAAALVAHAAAQPPPALETVLGRAGVYVLDLQQQLAGIVAEEDYVQDVRVSSVLGPTTRSGLPSARHRELKSDLLLVRPVGADRWVQFRDVFEVDGRPVRDRNERLMKLFVTPSSVDREPGGADCQ